MTICVYCVHKIQIIMWCVIKYLYTVKVTLSLLFHDLRLRHSTLKFVRAHGQIKKTRNSSVVLYSTMPFGVCGLFRLTRQSFLKSLVVCFCDFKIVYACRLHCTNSYLVELMYLWYAQHARFSCNATFLYAITGFTINHKMILYLSYYFVVLFVSRMLVVLGTTSLPYICTTFGVDFIAGYLIWVDMDLMCSVLALKLG